MKMRFGKRLRNLRLLTGMSQAALGEKVGCSQEFIGRIERGTSTPSFRLIENLAHALSTDPVNLFLPTDETDCDSLAPGPCHSLLSKVGSWKRNLITGELTVSPSFSALCGFPHSKDRDFQDFLRLVHPDDLPVANKAWESIYKGLCVYNISVRIIRPDGEVRRFLLSADVQLDDTGQPVAVEGPVADVTESLEMSRILSCRHNKLEDTLKEQAQTLSLNLKHLEQEIHSREMLEAGFRDLVDNMLEGLVRADAGGTIILANKAMALLAGYDSPQELIGMPMTALYPEPASREELLQALREHGVLRNLEFLLKRKDGSLIWTSANIKLVFDDAGNCLYTEGLLADISERKRAADEQRIHTEMNAYSPQDVSPAGHDHGCKDGSGQTHLAQDETVRSLLNATGDLVFFLDIEGRVLQCNDVLSRRFDLTPQQMVGRIVYDFFPHQVAQHRKRKVKEVFRSGEMLHFDDERGEKCISTTIYPVKDGQENVHKVLVIARDITQNRKALEALRQSEERFRSLFEHAGWSIFVHDLKGRFLDANPHACKALGYSREELLGMGVADIDPDLQERKDHELFWPVDTSEAIRIDARHRCKDGSIFLCEVTLRQVTMFGQRVILAMAQDVSLRKQAEHRAAIDRKRFEALYELSCMIDNSEGEIADAALEAIVAMTSSEVGYIYYMNEDETKLTLHAWSKNVMEQCSVPDPPKVYKVAATGLWGEAVRQRKPVITNDYESSPYRNGLPSGHVPISRHLNIPVFGTDGHIVAIAGVGNKQNEYEDADVRIMQLIMDGMWSVILRKRHKEILESRAAHYRALFDGNAMSLLLIDAVDGSIVDANASACEFYGWTRGQLRTKQIFEINTLSEEEILAVMERAARQNKRHFDFQHRLASGEVRDVEVFSAPIMLNGRKLLYSSVVDVTQIRDKERKLHLLFQASEDLICFASLDTAVFSRISPSFTRLLGYSETELTSRPFFDFIAPEDVAPTRDVIEKKLMAGEGVLDFEIRIICKDGSCRWVSWVANPIQERGLVIAVGRDMTMRRLAEAKVRESEERLNLALGIVNEGIWDWRVDTGEVHFNSVWYTMLGYEADEFPQEFATWQRLVHPDDLPDAEKVIEERLLQAQPYDIEFRMRAKSGEWRWIRARGQAVATDGSGQALRLLGTHMDITDLKQAQESLLRAKEAAEAANTSKSAFLANMSHEIRTPLNGLLGMLQLLQTSPLDDEQETYIQQAIQAGKRLTQLLSDVLDLAKVEAGKLQFVNENFNFRDTVTAVAHLFSPAARKKGLDLQVTIAPDIPALLCGDAARLQQILSNLVGNALKFTQKGHISLDAALLPQCIEGTCRVMISVVDTGIGIPDDTLEKLFQPFTQAEDSFRRQFQGAGLGLSICKRLAETMGGTIAVETQENVGTGIYLSIPLQQARAMESQLPETGMVAKVSELAILVAEDDTTSGMVAASLLKKMGHRVVVVQDGKQALEELKQDSFDVVLMDVQMPTMDGVEATRAVRQGDAGAMNMDIPIVAMTAYAMLGDKDSFFEAGMDAYIEKPVDSNKLSSVLGALRTNQETPFAH